MIELKCLVCWVLFVLAVVVFNPFFLIPALFAIGLICWPSSKPPDLYLNVLFLSLFVWLPVAFFFFSAAQGLEKYWQIDMWEWEEREG